VEAEHGEPAVCHTQREVVLSVARSAGEALVDSRPAGHPHCGLHAFRHTHSSLLVDMGAPVSVAQAQLRHEDPSVTLGTYSHVLGDSQREYAEKVAELLDYSGLKKRTSAVDSIS
jgi:integrase